MNTLFDVKQTVRSLIGDDDPNGWLKDSYLLPKINYIYRRQTLYIKRSTGMNLENMVEILNAFDANNNPTSQGLTSLAAYQQPGKPLATMYEPLTVWWKPAGSHPQFYREARPRKTILPGQRMGGSYAGAGFFSGGMEFTWRGNQLFVTPINGQIDILVDGRFNPPPLLKDQDVLVVDPDMQVALETGTIPAIGIEAGNPSWTQVMDEAEACCDDIVAKLVRQKQDVTARAGTNSGHRGPGSGGGWGWY